MRTLRQLWSTGNLLICGVVGPLLFIAVFMIESATRPGYNPFRSMVSELSLSSSGWQQIANFVVTGTLFLAFTVGLRRVLPGGGALAWGPRLLTISGLALITAGVFIADPGLAYPAGAPAGLPLGIGTWHGNLHSLSGMVFFFSLPAACLLLLRACRAGSAAGWRAYSVAAILFGIACFIASNISAMHGGPAGLFQRLSIGSYFVWLAVLALRLRRAAGLRPGGPRAQSKTAPAPAGLLRDVR